ncbi:GyrI-like domain-containing protein [Gracilimonas tropica]|uniref:GyrI-like domain-containing protein n=1 Tax=Gracilimonas tropica TaxID=454600 RepID=UPI0003773292|nr:GyrI-like domain-containing protein [Gracilimonas tropica]
MEIVKLDSFWVTGFEIQATFKELWEQMPKAWDTLFENADQITDRASEPFMDISFGKNQYGIYTQFIGAEVSGLNGNVPKGMQRLEISGDTYLHHKHTGSLKEIANSFGEMYTWAEDNNLTLGEFKLDIGYLPNAKESSHDLYIKIEDQDIEK